MIPNACVVEVIERVPDADVAIVAARVGERLGMPQERVRQLIDGRTGPITRALRPEKADAIAQTFEAAGVRVVIRAAEPEEIEEAHGGAAASAPAPPPPTAPVHDAVPDVEAAAAPAPDVPPDAADPAAPAAAHGTEDAFDADQGDSAEDGEVPEVDEVTVAGAGDATEIDEGRVAEADEALEAEEADEVDVTEAADAVEADAVDATEPADARVAEPRAAQPDVAVDAEAEPEAGPALEPEAGPALEPEALPEPWTDPEPVPGLDHEAPPDAPSEQALAREVAYIFSTGEAPAWRGDAVDLDRPGPGEDDDAAAGGPGGLLDVDDADDGGEADDDADGVARGEVRAARASFLPATGWDADDAGTWRTRRGEGGPAADERAAVPEFAIGRASRRSRGSDDADRAPDADAGAERPIPTAWRGLGGADAGPARPPSARLPRREVMVEMQEPYVADRAPRRRAVLLAALAVSVVLFVLAQWWVASRASAAVDPFDAYRRGAFAAARAAWDVQAAQGDPSARFMLGYLAEAGLGEPWSARAAAGWYRAAADAGHVEAMWRLGRLHEAGLGVPPDGLEARRWYRAAAEAGHGEAAFAWGALVLREAGVALGAGAPPQVPPATAAEAAAAFARAAALGWHEAAPYAAAFAAMADARP